MSIRITGMFSGLDTESIISELVSAQSVKKNSLVKAQTKLSWKQDAWKALNTKIYNFYTNTLSDMRYQSSYLKKITKVSNTNAISVITGDNAVDGVRSVKVNQLAKGGRLTGSSLSTKSGVHFSGAASLAQLRKHRGGEVLGTGSDSASLSGSFRVVGAQGQYVDFSINENTTIDDVVGMIKSTGLNANYDQESQRIFISSKNTGAANNFNLIAGDEGGMNALALLGLLSKDDIVSADPSNPTQTEIWAGYKDDQEAYNKLIADEIAKRQAAYAEANKKLEAENEALNKKNEALDEANTKFFGEMDDTDYLASEFSAKFGESLSGYMDKLYGDGGLYDEMQAAKKQLEEAKNNSALTDADKEQLQKRYDEKKAAYDEAEKKVTDFMEDISYGPLVEKKDEDGNTVYDDEGKPVMVREGGLKKEYEDAVKNGTVDDALKAKVDSVNKWYDAAVSLKENKDAIVANEAVIARNEAQIKDNAQYLDNGKDDVDNIAMSPIEAQVRGEFDARVQTAIDTLAAVNDETKAGMFGASKVNAQDAEIEIDGATFTSMTNTFSVNGLTLTAQEVTDKEITMTTSTDTDGIYGMIKNFFTEYNKLINEMDSLYNAESSKGYDPLLTEEKEALSEGEI